MTVISIAYEVPAATLEAIRAMLDDAARSNPDWNGADFQIVRDEFTGIQHESYDAAELMRKIEAIISGY